MHDLEPVAVRHLGLAERRARHDLEIALDGDSLRVDAKLAEHRRDGRAGGDPALLAVDADAQQYRRIRCRHDCRSYRGASRRRPPPAWPSAGFSTEDKR